MATLADFQEAERQIAARERRERWARRAVDPSGSRRVDLPVDLQAGLLSRARTSAARQSHSLEHQIKMIELRLREQFDIETSRQALACILRDLASDLGGSADAQVAA